MGNIDYWENPGETASNVKKETEKGLDLLNQINGEIISFFGSSQIKKDEKNYKHCEKVAFKLGEKGYAIVTGGGPGIMEAANSGANRAGATSIGIRAELIEGQKVKDNIYTKRSEFHFVFLRRFIMYVKSKAWIFYPGGFGTLDELFECIQLKYTGVRDKKPIICVDKKYWKGLFEWIEENAYKSKFLMHGKKDLELVHFVDTFDEISDILKKN